MSVLKGDECFTDSRYFISKIGDNVSHPEFPDNTPGLVFKGIWILDVVDKVSVAIDSDDVDDIVMVKCNGSNIVGRKCFTLMGNKPYVAFWKIPYAEPPVDELRFKEPIRHQIWLDYITYDLSKPYNDTCTTSLHEDCLHLSLFMPETPQDTKTTFPVLVWLHENSNMHGPDFFIDEGVLVVTVSYRTSILGFLNTGDDFAKGNMGAKDVVTALKWIRDNIFFFHGDVTRVTVAGWGEAAVLVASLILSNLAEDLFSRVIIQSGSALSPADYRNYNFEILNKLYWRVHGYNNKFDREALYDALSGSTVRELSSLSAGLFDSTEVRNSQRLINSFGPTIEVFKDAFMNKHPLEVYERKMANNNVDVLIGYTSLESLHKLGGFVNNRKLLKYLDYNFQYLLPFEGEPDEYGSRRYRKIAEKILNFYFINGTIGERSLRRYAKYVSDQVIYPVIRQARLHAESSCANVYLYRFAFRGSLNVGWDRIRNLNYSGATAGDEICYLFNCKSASGVYMSPEAEPERGFLKKMVRLWANYVKYGNPTPEGTDDVLGNLKWSPFVGDSELKGLSLGKKLKVVNVPEEKRIKFWDALKDEFFPAKDRISCKDEL